MELAPAIPSEEEEDEVNALGWSTAAIAPCKGKSIDTKGKSMDAKPMYSNAFALSGRSSSLHHTQGAALGYVLVAPSGRASDACFPSRR